MLLPADVLLRALGTEMRHVGPAADGSGVASSQQSVHMALRLLLAREERADETVRTQCARLNATLKLLTGDGLVPISARPALDEISAVLEGMALQSNLGVLETGWRDVLGRLESWTAAQLQAGSTQWIARLTAVLTDWEAADLSAQLDDAPDSGAVDTAVDAAKLEAYLRAHFTDPTLRVTALKQLPGGFGKQTFVFEAHGNAFRGAFVLRRDQLEAVLDNDCHRIETEYAVIRAVHAKGFPAPEALWLDTSHDLLPGGHFLVMRRAAGIAGGSVFTAQGGVPPDLAQTLAVILARLHALPAIEALGGLNESINSANWRSSLDACVRRYLADWREMFRRDCHLPSPAIAALFNWLLDHIPHVPARPVLLHGDMGFHNFLFDADRLTAVLDWEFAHLGDPAEDLAYVRNTLGATIDWPQFLRAYAAAGGGDVNAERIRFYQVWGHLRNAASSSIIAGKFAQGRIADLKMVQLPHLYIPLFLRAAQAAIDAGCGWAT